MKTLLSQLTNLSLANTLMTSRTLGPDSARGVKSTTRSFPQRLLSKSFSFCRTSQCSNRARRTHAIEILQREFVVLEVVKRVADAHVAATSVVVGPAWHTPAFEQAKLALSCSCSPMIGRSYHHVSGLKPKKERENQNIDNVCIYICVCIKTATVCDRPCREPTSRNLANDPV